MLEKIMQFVGEILNGIDPDRVKNGAMKAADMAGQAVQSVGGTEALNGIWNNYSWLIVGVLAIFLIYKLISVPFKLVINGLIGCVLLFGINFVGGLVNFTVPINIITALIAGIFGIPGIIGISVYYIFF